MLAFIIISFMSIKKIVVRKENKNNNFIQQYFLFAHKVFS